MIEHFVTINGIEVAASYSERAVKEIFLPLLEKLSALKRRKAGRILVIIAMYLGRIGPISIALFFGQDDQRKNYIRHSDGQFYVG